MIKRSSKAVLVLECPWGLDDGDTNRSSVLPFIDGIAKLAGDTEVFHANFYDKSSFTKALDYLCKIKFQSTVVYIAAHGYKKRIVDVDIIHILSVIGSLSRKCNITGVMLGSCYVGKNTIEMAVCTEDTNIKWCAGYSSTCDWLVGTMIDSSIISSMLKLDTEDFKDRDLIINGFSDAIAPFSQFYSIGEDYEEKKIKIRDSLQFICQPLGQGNRAKNYTDEVFEAYQDLQ